MNRNVLLIAVTGCSLLAAGCAQVEPQPLEPQRAIEFLEQRRLTDSDVLARVGSTFPGRDRSSAQAPWNRGELLVAAFQLNPSLAEARSQIGQVIAAMQTARALQNPTVSLAAEYDLSRAAEPSWLWGISTSLLLDTFLSRDIRIDLSAAELRGARADFSDAVWSVRRDLRSALLSVLMAERRIDTLEMQTHQREELVRLVHARVSAGESSRPEALQIEIEWLRSKAALDDARRARLDAQAKLAGSLGVTIAALDTVVLDWSDLEQVTLPSSSQLTTLRERALLSRPELARAIADYDARELEIRQQLRGQYLQVSIGPGYTYDHGVRKVTLGASVSLPVFNQNQGPIAEAVARREVAGKHVLTVQAKILNEIDAQAEAYTSALRALERAREQRAASESLANIARNALAIDAEDRPTTLTAEVAALTERIAELDALERAQLALGQLEDALHVPLFGPETELFREGTSVAAKEVP